MIAQRMKLWRKNTKAAIIPSKRHFQVSLKMSDYDKQQGALYWSNDLDPAMLQKVALISGHFLLKPGARIGDMGCGWGEGSFYLAKVNPHIQVVGIDNDPARIKHARATYGALPNLSYEIGDIENPDAALGPFDGLLNSSVLHHVYSYNQYNIQNVYNALHNQFAALNPDGVLAIRDFVAWPKDKFGYIDLPHDKEGDTPETMSSAALLVLYAQTAKALAAPNERGFFLDEVAAVRRGWRRFYLSQFWMADFMLRKDYLKAFYNEAQEVYPILSDSGYESALNALGGRVVYRGPFWNRWIVNTRWQGRAALWDDHLRPLDFPPTNYVALVEKKGPNASARVAERRVVSCGAAPYLTITSARHTETGMIYDMASRPGGVVDCLPYLVREGELFVAAKNGYPRPLANTVPRGTIPFDGKRFSGHLPEPVAVANVENDADIMSGLTQKAGLQAAQIEEIETALTYYPAPGLADEIVHSRFVALNPAQIGTSAWVLHKVASEVSGFSDSGDVRLYRAQELLRAAQVGILPEARLELNIYALMRAHEITPEPWIDGLMEAPASSYFERSKLELLLREEARQLFEPAAQQSGGYLLHRCSLFEDRSATSYLCEKQLEFVLPAKASAQAGVVIPLAQNQNGEICIGIAELDLPAPQKREGSSRIFVAPIHRFPYTVSSYHEAQLFLANQIGTPLTKLRRLGDGFYSSIGMTPEKLYPFVVAVDPSQLKEELRFVPLTSFYTKLETFRDAPLMIGGLRAIHALGLWPKCAAVRAASLGRPLLAPQAPANE